MDPKRSAQDVLRCHLCKTPVPSMYCDLCHIYFCQACVKEHLFDKSKQHRVIPLTQRVFSPNYPKCSTHVTKQCELHCKECDIPVCAQCLSSREHDQHTKNNILKTFEYKKEVVQRDLQELKNLIYPKCQDIASNISNQRADVLKNSQKILTNLAKQGNKWHTEIDTVINKMKHDLDKMDNENLSVLDKQERDITSRICTITQSIDDLQKLLDSNEVGFVSEYKSRNVEFRRLPPKLIVSLPSFIPRKMNHNQIYQEFGFMSVISRGAVPSPSEKQLIDEPLIISDIKTEFGVHNGLRSVSCLSDQDLWMCGEDNLMRLYSLEGNLVKAIQTKSRNVPVDITVTRNGELVYTDEKEKTVNVVKNKTVKKLISYAEWMPCGVCSTSSGDLLVILNSNSNTQTKVVRYFGSKEKQVIQLNEEGQSLFSSGYSKRYITENRNLDICVSDCIGCSVVVVNKAGKHRFTYTGPPSTSKDSFDPRGIATDSQSQILTTDFTHRRVHILDQDGAFLRYIANCDLDCPWGLCLESRNNLFIAEWETGKVKKIQYRN